MVCEGGALPCLFQCPGNGGSSEEQALLGSRSCCIQTGSASRAQQQRLLRLRPFFCLLSPGSPCQVHRHICSPPSSTYALAISLPLTHTHSHTHTRTCLMLTPAPTPPPPHPHPAEPRSPSPPTLEGLLTRGPGWVGGGLQHAASDPLPRSWLGWVVAGRWGEGAEGTGVLGPDFSGSGRGGQFLKGRV